jgi:hypothetical protein
VGGYGRAALFHTPVPHVSALGVTRSQQPYTRGMHEHSTVLWVAVGIAAGAGSGMVAGNIPMGISLGFVLGFTFGVIESKR